MLVAAIVIHGPDFFVPALGAHVRNLRLRNSSRPAAEDRDDIVRELVRQLAGSRVGRRPAINFLQRNRRLRIVNVRQISRGSQVRAFADRLPYASMYTFAGAAAQSANFTSLGWLGICGG